MNKYLKDLKTTKSFKSILARIGNDNGGMRGVHLLTGIDEINLNNYIGDKYLYLSKEDGERLIEFFIINYAHNERGLTLKDFPTVTTMNYSKQMDAYKKLREKQRKKTMKKVKDLENSTVPHTRKNK